MVGRKIAAPVYIEKLKGSNYFRFHLRLYFSVTLRFKLQCIL